jgi:GNAT superfamily N-acetyltransferase
MAALSVERTIGETKRAVLAGLVRYNGEQMGPQRYRRFAVSLRDKGAIVGGVVGEVWMTVLFIQLFWIDQRYRGKGHGTALIEQIETEARKFGAVRAYVDTMSAQAPGFYRKCGYDSFGVLDGYPGGVTRHWFAKAL